MKGLPLAYSKDMQEDKEAVFDAAETLELMLAAMTGMVRDMTHQRGGDEDAPPAPAMRPRPTLPTGWCARPVCRSARRITSPAAPWRWPRQGSIGLEELPLAESAGDQSGDHRQTSFRC